MHTRDKARALQPAVSDFAAPILVLSVALMFGLGGYCHWNGLWGLNHLRFLPPAFHLFAWFIIGAIAVLMFRCFGPLADKVVRWVDGTFFGPRQWRWRLGLAFVGGVLFWVLRARTHFLGDGVTWVANFSHEGGYVHKWTESLSIPFVRFVQGLMGEYTTSTAEASFQIISVMGGVVVLITAFPLIERLLRSAAVRLTAITTLLFSGTGLLYFGYVEFYPLLWALVMLLLLAAVIWLQERKPGALVAALLLYAAALAVHVQVIWLSGALLVLIPGLISRHDCSIHHIRLRVLSFALVLGALILYGWIVTSPPHLNWMVLPLLAGRIESPNYAVLSPKHLFDLLNLLFLIAPGAFALVLTCWRRTAGKPDAVAAFLGVASLGGFLFALLLNPVIGLGRDWDLMSLPLLPFLLWLFHRVDRKTSPLAGRAATGLMLLAMVSGVSFLATNLHVSASEARYLSLLRWYGGKDYNGWKAFETYLTTAGRSDEADRLADEIRRTFPRHASLAEGWRYLQSGQPTAARQIAEQLVMVDPDRAEYLHLLGESLAAEGNLTAAEERLRETLRKRPDYGPALRSLAQLRMRTGDFPLARTLLRQARAIDPTAEAVLEDLGAVYLRLNCLDSAAAVADTLLRMNGRSAGGHLIAMLAALQAGDRATACGHYRAYRDCGRNRPEYSRIIAAYSDLALD